MKNIEQIDANFKVETNIDKSDIRFYDGKEAPFSLHGVFYEDGLYRRLPQTVADSVSERVGVLSTNTAGGRLRFRTDSPYIAVSAKMQGICKMSHFTLTASAGFDLYVSDRFVKSFVPPFKITDGFESVIELGSSQMRDVTIHFPLYSAISALYIGLSDTAVVEKAAPYGHTKPVVYYGSSITQGGCASRPGNAYTNILSRWLDVDHINLGFSGSARAEDAMAQYVKDLEMSVFVYDYDHNAPTVEHLEKTHERMFRTVRQANPDLPVVILSRPKYELNENEMQRRDIIARTYERAKAEGGRNVYFLDGKALMEMAEGEGTVDGCHPTDLGFYSMANALKGLLNDLLNR